MKFIAAIVVLASLGACSSLPEPVYYLLEPSQLPSTQISDQSPIGVREIGLPLYARQPQIALRGPDGVIQPSENHRWGDEPARATTRLISQALMARLNRSVVNEPWPLGVAPNTQINIQVDYIAGALEGDLRLRGQVQMQNRNTRRTPVSQSFDITEPVGPGGFNALVQAHVRAYEKLADLIAQMPGIRG